jgi:hypothetical protein
MSKKEEAPKPIDSNKIRKIQRRLFLLLELYLDYWSDIIIDSVLISDSE